MKSLAGHTINLEWLYEGVIQRWNPRVRFFSVYMFSDNGQVSSLSLILTMNGKIWKTMVTSLSKPKIRTHGLSRYIHLSSKCKRQLRKSNLVSRMWKFQDFSHFLKTGDRISKTGLHKITSWFSSTR